MKKILVTGVGGTVGGLGQKIVQNLLDLNIPVRAMARKASDITEVLAGKGADILVGDLTSLTDIHRALDGCETMYFGMGVSPNYLEATTNVAAVARHVGLKALVNISQMTVSQMSVTETTTSPQQKQQWLSEQVLNWSAVPVVHVRSTVFMENPLFHHLAKETIRTSNQIRLPFGAARTSPIASRDVAAAISEILINPDIHLGKIYELTGPKSEAMFEIARHYSNALKREITYVDVPYTEWKEQELPRLSLPTHVNEHISAMAWLHAQNMYDRQTNDFKRITGQEPIDLQQWVTSELNLEA